MPHLMRRLIDIISMPLTEHAFRRHKIFEMMEGIAQPLGEHMVKLLAFEADEGLRHHWKMECLGFIKKIAGSTTKNGRYLKEKEYMAGLFSPYFEPYPAGTNQVKLLRRYTMKQYPQLSARPLEDAQILESLHKIYQWIAVSLASGGAGDEIIDKL